MAVGRPGANRGQRYPAEPLTAGEVRRLLRACSNRAPTGVRNRALIVVLWRGGLRLAEALALMPKDVDTEQGTLRVLHGKGDRSRTVGIDPEACAILQRWLDRRQALGINSRSTVFCTLAGGPLKQTYVRAVLPRLARRAGIDKRVHPHGLRHTHAAELAHEGVPLNVVQVQLGHTNAATTSRYLQHIAPQQVIETMRQRTWSLEDNGVHDAPDEPPAAAPPAAQFTTNARRLRGASFAGRIDDAEARQRAEEAYRRATARKRKRSR